MPARVNVLKLDVSAVRNLRVKIAPVKENTILPSSAMLLNYLCSLKAHSASRAARGAIITPESATGKLLLIKIAECQDTLLHLCYSVELYKASDLIYMFLPSSVQIPIILLNCNKILSILSCKIMKEENIKLYYFNLVLKKFLEKKVILSLRS